MNVKPNCLRVSIATAILAMAGPVLATDFSIVDAEINLTGSGTEQVAANGLVGTFEDVPHGSTVLPALSFDLETVTATDGTYTFQLALVIDDDASARRLEARINNFTLTVSGGALTAGAINGNLNLTAKPASAAFEVTSTTSNTGIFTFSGGTLTFDAAAIQGIVSNAVLWNTVLNEFMGDPSHYTYSLLVKQISSTNGDNARFGIEAPSFTALPCMDPAELSLQPTTTISAPAYNIRGQFSQAGSAESFLPAPGINPVECVTPGPGPDPVAVEDIEDALDDVIIPTDPNAPISEAALESLEEAAELAAEYVADLIDNIESTSNDTIIDALTLLGQIVDVSGNVTEHTNNLGDEEGSERASAAGAETLSSFAELLAALEGKLSDADVELTDAQKAVVLAASENAILAIIDLIEGGTPATQASILESLGSIVTSLLNLNITMTDEQVETLLEAIELLAPSGSVSFETLLDFAISISPTNQNALTLEELAELLEGSSLSDDEIARLQEELASGINISDVTLGDLDGRAALLAGLNGGLLPGVEGDVEFDEETGNTVFSIGDTRSIPGRVVDVFVVPDAFPDGLSMTGDGVIVIASGNLAAAVVPSSHDPVALYAAGNAAGEFSMDDRGNLRVTPPGGAYFLSGAFDYKGTVSGGPPQEAASITVPTGDPASIDYVFTVTYPDGTKQAITPLLADGDFVDSARGRGLNVSTDRNTGVVTVNGLRYRPSYFVDALTASSQAYLDANKDSSGIAYRAVDVNGDGKVDFEVISEQGVQIAYGL